MKFLNLLFLVGSINCLKEGEPCIGVDEKCDEGLFCCPSCTVCKSNDVLDEMLKITGAKDKKEMEEMVRVKGEEMKEKLGQPQEDE